MIVLASQSPRRSEILRQAGIPFAVKPANVDETARPGESPEDYVKRVARDKAMAAGAAPGETVLGGDTVGVVDGAILGKPANSADAVRMLGLLAGREHRVLTGICLQRDAEMVIDCASTRVWFRPLTPEEITGYIASGEPMDKAGAYAIQGLGSKFIERIEGSYTNVVGLPIELVQQILRKMETA